MTRVVMLEDYLDDAKQIPSVQALAARAELHIHTTKASSEAETVARTREMKRGQIYFSMSRTAMSSAHRVSTSRATMRISSWTNAAFKSSLRSAKNRLACCSLEAITR